MRLFIIPFFLLIGFGKCLAQQNAIALPTQKDWNIVKEGDTLRFSLTSHVSQKYYIAQGKILGMELDSAGHFNWLPDYSLVRRDEKDRLFQISIEGINSNSQKSQANIELILQNKNRKPVVSDIRPFYIKYNMANNYKFTQDEVYDEDNDPIVFIPDLETLPEGMTMASNGEIFWTPSINQYKNIKSKPVYISFTVQDQPSKTLTKGKLKLEVTQQDLPPSITTIPKSDYLKIKENETLNIRIYASDPNGDEDIEVVDFLSNYPIDKSVLKKINNNQFEFSWIPNYDFVQDPKDSLNIELDFFALDKSQKREVKKIYVSVKNTVNEAENDKKLYNLYYAALAQAWELEQQLKEKEEALKKEYNKARKGKKNRSVVNASLGATTGLSSVMTKSADTQRLIATLGGTTVLTIGTLEATEVLGRSMKDLMDRLNYVIEKKNEVQTKGDIFARDYSLKASRRNTIYIKALDDFMASMSLKGLVALELNATWEAKEKPTEEKVKKVFKDFNAWANSF